MSKATDKIWRKLERERYAFYRYFTKAWQKELLKQVDPYLKALNDPQSIGYVMDLNTNMDYTEIFGKTWIITGKHFATETYNQHHKSCSCNIRTKEGEPQADYLETYMHDFAINQAGERITSIKVTNKNAIVGSIRRHLDYSIHEGMGIDETARYIQENLKNDMYTISRYNAERIARTEIIGASNRGQLLGAQTLGYSMQKQWIPTIDSATRTFNKGPFNHAVTEVVGLNDKFTATGGELDHPGDPKGEAGNIINCRCGIGFIVL